MLTIFALSTEGIDNAIFKIANALEVPVLILALAALALVIFELGSFFIELRGRQRRRFSTLSQAAERARAALAEGDRQAALAALKGVARSPAMASTLAFIVEHAGTEGSDHQLNKALADFDFASQRRLGRTRTAGSSSTRAAHGIALVQSRPTWKWGRAGFPRCI